MGTPVAAVVNVCPDTATVDSAVTLGPVAKPQRNAMTRTYVLTIAAKTTRASTLTTAWSAAQRLAMVLSFHFHLFAQAAYAR